MPTDPPTGTLYKCTFCDTRYIVAHQDMGPGETFLVSNITAPLPGCCTACKALRDANPGLHPDKIRALARGNRLKAATLDLVAAVTTHGIDSKETKAARERLFAVGAMLN